MGNGHHAEGGTGVCPAPEHHPKCGLPAGAGKLLYPVQGWCPARRGVEKLESLFTSPGCGAKG